MNYRDFDYEYFYIVEQGDTVSGILKKSFGHMTASDMNKKLKTIAQLNPHIRDLDRIHPGTFICLGVNPTASMAQAPNALAMDELGRVFASFSPQTKTVVREQSEFLNYFGILLKYGDYSLESGEKYIDLAKTALQPGVVKVTVTEIRRLHIQTLIKAFEEVHADRVLVGLQTQVRVFSRNIIRITIDDDSGLRAYVHQLESLGRIGKSLKMGGRFVKGADLLLDGKEVYDAWGTPERDKKVAEVGAKTGAGSLGGFLSNYLVCNLAFGLPSEGTSALWCGALAGGTGAVAGGFGGAKFGDWLYETKWGKKFVKGLVETFTIPPAY